jgi:phosphoglucosamine mutase
VGDRYVAEQMRALDLNVGGEQSGHVILSDYATTGDGLLAALQVLAVLVQEGRSAAEVCRVFERLPQRLKNVRFSGASPLRDPRVQRDIAGAEAMLGERGRVLIRESGTEPLVRVMAEGEDEAAVARVVDALCTSIAEAARVAEGSMAEDAT